MKGQDMKLSPGEEVLIMAVRLRQLAVKAEEVSADWMANPMGGDSTDLRKIVEAVEYMMGEIRATYF